MPSQSRKVIGELEAFLTTIVKKVTSTTALILEEDTPELTGFAESNWVPQIGRERTEPIGSRQAVDFNALEAGVAIVDATYKLPALVYISNPVSYIGDLNLGTSAQAPSGYVQTSIAKAIKSII